MIRTLILAFLLAVSASAQVLTYPTPPPDGIATHYLNGQYQWSTVSGGGSIPSTTRLLQGNGSGGASAVSSTGLVDGTGSAVTTTNTVFVNVLSSSGDGSSGNPWVGFDSSPLTNAYTLYVWPTGFYKITSTLDLLNTNTYHLGNNSTILFYGTGTAVRFSNPTSWTMGCLFDSFTIDCANATRPSQTPTSITGSSVGGANPTATVTLTSHGYSVGDIVDIIGADQPLYNGVRFVATVPDANHFTYKIEPYLAQASPATGTIQVRKSSVALQLNGVRFAQFNNINVQNCSLGLASQACVTWGMSNFRCSKFQQPGWAFTVQPISGMLFDERKSPGSGEYSTCGVFDNTSVEGTSDYGILMFTSHGMEFTGGTSEANGGGLLLGYNGVANVFSGFDFESNSVRDVSGASQVTTFQDCLFLDNVSIGGRGNHFLRGSANGLTILSGSDTTTIDGIAFGNSSQLTNNGTSTQILGAWAGAPLANQLNPSVITNSQSTDVPLVIDGLSGQTNALFKINAGGTNGLTVNNTGSTITLQGRDAFSRSHITAAAGTELVLDGITSGHYIAFGDNVGTMVAAIRPDIPALSLGSSDYLVWTSGNPFNAVQDTGLARDSAGVVRVSNGGSGNGTLKSAGNGSYGVATITTAATGATNTLGVNVVLYVTAATSAALTDNAGTTEFSGVSIAAFTPIRLQPGGKFTGSSITYATGTASHAW